MCQWPMAKVLLDGRQPLDRPSALACSGQATYELVDNLRATVGYRATWEDVNFRYVDDGSVPEDAHQLAGVPLPPIFSEREPSWTH